MVERTCFVACLYQFQIFSINMLRKTLSIFISMFCFLSVMSQSRVFTVVVSPIENDTEVFMYMNPLNLLASYNAEPMIKIAAGEYKVEIPCSENGFYSLVMVKGGAQFITSIYMPGKEHAKIDVKIENNYMSVENSVENTALTAYSAFSAKNSRLLWNAEPADEMAVKTIIEHFISAADSITEEHNCNAHVKEYIKLWAYTITYNAVHSAKRNAHRVNHELSFDAYDILGDISKTLDSDISMLFQETYYMIVENMKNDTPLIDKFEYLYDNYTNKSVRSCVGEALLNRFLLIHSYETDFEGGLVQLQQVIEKYGYDTKYIAEYKKHKAMIKGTPFPENVILRTAEGDTVAFSAFKGKYVYIDMWASWCNPCRKEIPHLQKLEKELQNKDVAFVSISIDKDEKAWKDKLAYHNMHGNQFIDNDNLLGQALNVKGIPFFVIYDKEGLLYMYGAPRPSVGTPLKEMLEQLH